MAGRIEVVGKRHRISYTVKIVLSTIVFAVLFAATCSGLGNILYDHLAIGYLCSSFWLPVTLENSDPAPTIGAANEGQEEDQGIILIYIWLCVGWAIYLTGAFLAYSLFCCILDHVIIRMKRPPGKKAVRLIFFTLSLVIPPVLGIWYSQIFLDVDWVGHAIESVTRLFSNVTHQETGRSGKPFAAMFHIPFFGLFVAYGLLTIYNTWMLLTPAYVIRDSEQARSSLPQRLSQSEAADSLSQRTAALEEKVALLTATIEKLKKGREGSHAGES